MKKHETEPYTGWWAKKGEAANSRPWFCQILADFQKCLTGRFPDKSAVKSLLKIPPHLVYAATLPCETLMSENERLSINYKTVYVATYLNRGGVFNNDFTANLPRNLPVKRFENRLKFDRIMATSFWPHFFGPSCTFWEIGITARTYTPGHMPPTPRLRSGV